MFSGYSRSTKKLHLLYDLENEQYNVITNLKGAMAKQYICSGCDTLYNFIYKCDKVSSPCTASSPCTKDQTKHCTTCNRRFLSEKRFQNHLSLKVKGKLYFHWRQVCRNCSYLVTDDSKQECFKKLCNICNKSIIQGTFATWLTWILASCRTLLCTFSSVRSAHKTLRSVMGLLNTFRNPFVLSKFVVWAVDDLSVDYEQCGKSIHAFCQEP